MKSFVCVIVCACLLYGCRKQQPNKIMADENLSPFLGHVKGYLKDSLSPADFAAVDFHQTNVSRSENICWIQLGMIGKDAAKDFIVVQTDTLGHGITGRIIRLEKSADRISRFNGRLEVQSLHRSPVISSIITNGYVTALHPRRFETISTNGVSAPNILPAYVQELPEVVVVGYTPTSGAQTIYRDYISFQQIIGAAASSGTSSPYSGFYSSIGASGGSGASAGGLPLVQVNYETSYLKPGIDVTAFMKCFSGVPDAGAECSITIFTDLPVNNNPSIFFDWVTGATGHVFLQLTKATGMQSVTQIVGFTAQKPFSAITTDGPVAGKVVDNTGHKYNAYLMMDISIAQLRSAITEIEFLASTMSYDIARYNCVDFALQVINTIRGTSPLIIPKYQIPGQTFSTSNTPEGLYTLLASMKAAGGTESRNIVTGGVLHAGTSHGPCN